MLWISKTYINWILAYSPHTVFLVDCALTTFLIILIIIIFILVFTQVGKEK